MRVPSNDFPQLPTTPASLASLSKDGPVEQLVSRVVELGRIVQRTGLSPTEARNLSGLG